MIYQEAVDYLNSFINYEKKIDYPYSKKIFGLKRISLILEKLGNPHKDFKTIHVAGSKGKGSVACFCASILKEAGFKTGLYTSPHLETFRERIRVNDEFISKEDLVDIVQIIKPHIEDIGTLSFFEVYTACAFFYFKKKKVDIAVIEVGLGGRLDATNVIEPLVGCITPISYEHTNKLGHTLSCIAGEKSGIIKKEIAVISSPQEKEALDVIIQTAKTNKCKIYIVGQDICYELLEDKTDSKTFKIKGILGEYDSLKINLLGEHQIANAAAAVGAIEALRLYDIVVSAEDIRKGLLKARWPGRMEVMKKNPFVVLDGAQNTASARALAEAVKKNFAYDKLILVLGISKDKDISGIVNVLQLLADDVIVTRANLPRAAEPSFIASFFNRGENIDITQSVEEALKKACHKAKEKDLILICGSLFVVGEARRQLRLAVPRAREAELIQENV